MPNLKQSQLFRQTYGSAISQPQWLSFLAEESFQKSILENRRKGLQLNEGFLGKITQNIQPKAQLQPKDSESIIFLETQQKVNSVLLFIDITSFSTKIKDWTTEQLSKYLDDYYDKVIPIIYKYGGEVEKIIGDGIICIFAKPFCEKEILSAAYSTAIEIISTLKNTDKEVKIALHYGIIMYYKNKTDYFEYTIIGQPLTELWRLESIAESNAINFYSTTLCDKILSVFNHTNWYLSIDKAIVPSLKGVSYTHYKTLTKIY